MILLLSGEGPSDMGRCDHQNGFKPGPMALFVDQLVERHLAFSCLETGCVRFISEQALTDFGKKLVQRKSPRLPGKKYQKETCFFERNAQALAVKAQELAAEVSDEVISVLFRDADGTALTCRGLYEKKRDSMVRGFELQGYLKGIPMIAKPKSEAWLLCAVKPNPYSHCDALESTSGNDSSPNALKQQLEKALSGHIGSWGLAEMVSDGTIDVHRIDMPSLNWFKERLNQTLNVDAP
ncbi:MAG: hypothetical protein Q9M26_08290 [Mariprofundales bacterium]|nr:hypothetical protein [Mariprofundales bacterium]